MATRKIPAHSPARPAAPRAPARPANCFGAGMPRGWTTDRSLLGGKGAGLSAMSKLKLPVPPGFTITTEVSAYIHAHGRHPKGLDTAVARAMAALEKAMRRGFGDPRQPLLVSVRSGARVSMPGMMDTVLNLGLNHATVAGLAAQGGNPRFAWDAYRRFIAMYGDVVLGLCRADHYDPFEQILYRRKKRRGVTQDTDLNAEDLRAVAEDSLAHVQSKLGKPFPADPWEQLWGSIDAVFRSWSNDRAVAYRRLNGISDSWGTAVTVQGMVFGNLGEDSATGVCFTRNPATGDKEFFGEFLPNAQGEDVVAGTRTPFPIAALAQRMPAVYQQLLQVRDTLEAHFGDMQDMEFTVERGRLFVLQTRSGKRTGSAAVRIATDMVAERRLSPQQALLKMDAEGITQLLAPVFSGADKDKALAEGRLLGKGLNAGPGAATGRVVFRAADAVEWSRRGEPVILVRQETSPEDIRGMNAAAGILTQHGGMTSHAALVARQMGKVCVAGAGSLDVDTRKKVLSGSGKRVREGDWLSLDGSSGEVLSGRVPTEPSAVLRVVLGQAPPSADGDDARFRAVMAWADRFRRLGVRANADQPDQAALAVAFGAEGIGLCRTEHMFFGEEKLPAVQRMILADDTAARRAALSEIEPLQRKDFEGIFRAMGDRPVTIRTIDPPLHEFLPHDEKALRVLCAALDIPYRKARARWNALREANPMLGFRGCRLTWLYPEILEVQVTAIFEAAAKVSRQGIRAHPEIMIPLVGHRDELKPHVALVRRVAAEVAQRTGVKVAYAVGTMIEIPRAALTAAQVAEEAEFFSFGTNDLTQTTLGVSRDDSGLFLPQYVDAGIYGRDPFVSVDLGGVGRLMQMAVEEGRGARKGLKIGICGEHGGDPATVGFCHRLGLDYVSASPFRLPVARLAAAQAALRQKSVRA